MQLEIIINGLFHAVALLHLTRPAIKILQDRHPENWRSHLGLMTVGPNRKSLLAQFLEQGKYTPKVNVLRRGMHLQAKHFGIEVLADNCDEAPDQIDSKQTEIPLLPMLQGFGEDDLLGVFQLQLDASMTYTWESAPAFDCTLLKLHLENFGRILNVKDRFDLIRTITYADAQPTDRKLTSLGRSRMLKHIFHVTSQT
ncbi:MAG: hypothetical protein AB7E32_14825 [Desulfovibrio sp.]